MKAARFIFSASAIAMVGLGPKVAAQSSLPDVNIELPLTHTCPAPPSSLNNTRCTTPIIGNATVVILEPIISTPLPDGSARRTGQLEITFDGQLQVEGVRLQNNSTAASLFSPGQGALPTVGASSKFTVDIDQNIVGGQAIANPGMSYSHNYLNVSSINIDVENEDIDIDLGLPEKIGGTYSLKSVNPSNIVNNSTIVEGIFKSDGDSSKIIFGKISGVASVESGTLTTTLGDPSNPLSYLSPYGLVLQATPVITTQLDENGLLTPAIAVTNGIEMNGSRIHGLADGIAASDAATVGQLRSFFKGSGSNSVQIGNGSQAINGASVAIGYGNTASGNGAVAIGDPVVATGQGAVAMGYNTNADGEGAVALGSLSQATGTSAVALGANANANEAGSIAVGHNTNADGEGAVALGSLSQATGTSAVALGANANANEAGSIAVGDAARATGISSIAIGKDSNATFSGSTAIGVASSTSRANQVVVGGEGSSLTVGDIDASTAAQNGSTDILTVDSSGTIGHDTTIRPAIAALATVNAAQDSRISAIDMLNLAQNDRLGALESAQSTLSELVHQDRQDARRGIAAAVALAQAAMPSGPGKTSYVFNLANYRGEQALGGSIAHRFEAENPFAMTLGFSHAGGKNTAARVGIAGEF